MNKTYANLFTENVKIMYVMNSAQPEYTVWLHSSQDSPEQCLKLTVIRKPTKYSKHKMT